MLLPYQPIFKEEEPAIVMAAAGCSPSPTLHGAQLQHQSSLQSAAQVGSPAVLVSANKFVSVDPAKIRRNQFMVSEPDRSFRHADVAIRPARDLHARRAVRRTGSGQ